MPAWMQVVHEGETRRFPASSLAQIVLSKLRQVAASQLPDDPTHCVISLGGTSGYLARAAAADSAADAGWIVSGVTHDAVAAATALRMEGMEGAGSSNKKMILVDWGAGSLEVSLVAADEAEHEGGWSLAFSESSSEVGGILMDRLVGASDAAKEATKKGQPHAIRHACR